MNDIDLQISCDTIDRKPLQHQAAAGHGSLHDHYIWGKALPGLCRGK